MCMADYKPVAPGWNEIIALYGQPRVVGMVFLGFSAGLPFLLVFSTLSAWLRDAGVALGTIGFFSWVGITYSIKVFWAPVIDRLGLPFLTPVLGQRRSWMLLAQLIIASGLAAMAFTEPLAHLGMIAVFALVVAFGSATQDITIDAYRIEAMEVKYQGAMAAAYVFGYRVALLVAGAGAFYLADFHNWSFAYQVMSLLMLVGISTTLIIDEPEHRPEPSAQQLEQRLELALGVREHAAAWQRLSAWFVDAVVSPFVEFFRRSGKLAVLILLLIGCYRLSDITMGVMANPFYLDLGFSKTDIANITKVFGFFMTIGGAAVGGICVVRFGIMRPLLAGAILVAATNLLFVALSRYGPDLTALALVVSADNLSGGFATSVFVAYLSSLTHKSYTATQYALFSSLMTLPAKFLGGYAGIVVEQLGYAHFFLYAGLLGLPAILLVVLLLRKPS